MPYASNMAADSSTSSEVSRDITPYACDSATPRARSSPRPARSSCSIASDAHSGVTKLLPAADDTFSDAWIALGDLCRELAVAGDDPVAQKAANSTAQIAYKRYLALEPNGPQAKNARRWLSSLQ